MEQVRAATVERALGVPLFKGLIRLEESTDAGENRVSLRPNAVAERNTVSSSSPKMKKRTTMSW